MNILARCMLPLFMLLAMPAWAAPVSDQSIAQLLELSGMRQQLASFPEQVVAGMEMARRQRSGAADASLERAQQSMQAAFHLEDLLTPVRSALKRDLSEADAGRLLAWIQSANGRRITQAEEVMAAPTALQDMLAQVDVVRRDKPRLAFAHRLDVLLGITDMNLLLQEYTGLAIHAAMQNTERPRQALDAEGYRRLIKAQLVGARARTEEMVTLSLAHAYRDIPVAELASYERFLKTPAATRFYRAAAAGMTRGYTIVLDKMMQAMVDSVTHPETRI